MNKKKIKEKGNEEIYKRQALLYTHTHKKRYKYETREEGTTHVRRFRDKAREARLRWFGHARRRTRKRTRTRTSKRHERGLGEGKGMKGMK